MRPVLVVGLMITLVSLLDTGVPVLISRGLDWLLANPTLRLVVALARVLLHDPAIFILDEATASVDPFTEAQIQDGLEGGRPRGAAGPIRSLRRVI